MSRIPLDYLDLQNFEDACPGLLNQVTQSCHPGDLNCCNQVSAQYILQGGNPACQDSCGLLMPQLSFPETGGIPSVRPTANLSNPSYVYVPPTGAAALLASCVAANPEAVKNGRCDQNTLAACCVAQTSNRDDHSACLALTAQYCAANGPRGYSGATRYSRSNPGYLSVPLKVGGCYEDAGPGFPYWPVLVLYILVAVWLLWKMSETLVSAV